MFPRHFLCSHFWSIQQKFDFYIDLLRRRLRYNLPVFRFMQSKLNNLKENPELFDKFKNMLGRLGSGLHPTSQDILSIKEIFTKSPFSLESMPSNHLV